MFSQMDVYLNNKLVSFNTNNYPWKAYFKTILFSEKDELNSQREISVMPMHTMEGILDWSCDMDTHSKVQSLS